ncbi:1,4-dihydroxy-2-naphthoate octaprenyltransferase [Halobacteriales archaeon QH_2_65_14]|nr:MAG: 1,4-dihydroxy-2-naphthoate octaprenyltransferase [Halobacteriales archaeon QH_2_65_14]
MRRSTLARVLFETSRPSQLLLILVVYLFGALAAAANGAAFATRPFALGAVPLLCLSASVHYANEYADYGTDALTERTPFSGGSGALQRTNAPRTVPLYAGFVAMTAGTVATATLFVRGWLAASAVGVLVLATAVGWQYSVGPLRLAWRGWGELTNAALGGLALPVYGAAVLDGPLGNVALASIPFFLVVWLNLFATQWPDREADAAVGKRTLAVRWSPRRLRRAYVGIALAAALSVVALHGAVLPTVLVLASVAVTPLLIWGAWGYTRRHVPWPTVSAMVALVVLQCLAWAVVVWC